MSWTDLVCAYIVVACLWGDRLLAWLNRICGFPSDFKYLSERYPQHFRRQENS